jgi:hypothetical protein
MSTFPIFPTRRRPRPASGIMLAVVGAALWLCGDAVASAISADAPVDVIPVPVVPATPAAAGDTPGLAEVERQRRLHELRRHLLEHSRSWRGDAGIRRSAAIPEPTDPPAVVADKILPRTPLPGIEETAPTSIAPARAMPLTRGTAALPDAVPEALAAPVVPALRDTLTQDPGSVQATASRLEAGAVVDGAAANRDSRLTDRERRQLRQQLRQVLRMQESLANP